MCKDLESQHEELLYDTDIRWLSKGNMLSRVYELKEKIKEFHIHKG